MTAAQRDDARFGSVAFEVEARLLQELGERLVASPDVALLELIKNSSDADAPECRVMLGTRFGKPTLTIADDGVGIGRRRSADVRNFGERWASDFQDADHAQRKAPALVRDRGSNRAIQGSGQMVSAT